VGRYPFLENLVGISISHISHWLSVIVLYGLTRALCPGPKSKKLAFITACLHVLSPAGLFLSAPYSESTFALLNFTGALLFVQSHGHPSALNDSYVMFAGACLGCATTIRSNGLLNGIIFLEEAFRVFFSLKDGLHISRIRRLGFTVVGGILIAVGFVFPQYIAYQQFCGQPALGHIPPRIWCQRTLPSIYTFVQDYYWYVPRAHFRDPSRSFISRDNGFLRYWTVSNIPLFLLAAPMLAILTISAYWAMYSIQAQTSPKNQAPVAAIVPSGRLFRSLAFPQLLLAMMALVNHHVQIITRISSGYPIWYIWLAAQIMDANNKTDSIKMVEKGLSRRTVDAIVKYSVLYALIQGGLFSSFLPPA
jgi:phosphatidylinositol glycan class V